MTGNHKENYSRKKINRLIKKGQVYLKTHGLKQTLRRTVEVALYRTDYGRWMKEHQYSSDMLAYQRAYKFDRNVVFSIVVPLFNTDREYLIDMIESVKSQTYGGWELCLADGSDDGHSYVGDICRECAKDDSRIRYKKLDSNKGIVGNSNEAIKLAAGDYISLLDHDDILHPAALFRTMEAVSNKNADLIYTDEATFRGNDINKIVVIHFKPDYAPDNLLANNYICHFTSFRRTLLDECGGAFREGYEGSQDHELMLRLTSKAGRIVHVPEVMYYWRSHEGSTAASADNKTYCTESGIKAVTDHLSSQGIKASVESARGLPTVYRVRYDSGNVFPKVSIVILNHEHIDDLRKCVDSILTKTPWPDYELIIVENNSRSPELFEYYAQIQSERSNVKVIVRNETFNWSAFNNYGIENSSGEYCVCLNNDTVVINSDWLEEMMMYAKRSDVGAVGAMLYYPDDTIQHAGVVLGLGGVAAHAFIGSIRGEYGYMGRLCYAQDMTAVTGACMLIKKSVWKEVGGFDEALANDYNDLDYCLKVRSAGYLIVWTPYAELYHYESLSRGFNEDPYKRESFRHDSELIRTRWKNMLDAGDPYYNPNLTVRRANFSPRRNGESREPDYIYENND